MFEKASKALYKQKGLQHNTDLKPDVSMNGSDQLIKQIALYGSGIWVLDDFFQILYWREQPIQWKSTQIHVQKIDLVICILSTWH